MKASPVALESSDKGQRNNSLTEEGVQILCWEARRPDSASFVQSIKHEQGQWGKY